jgi:hypothetical protein
MKVYRYMSSEELKKFQKGEEILPLIDHKASGKATDAGKELCFLPERILFKDSRGTLNTFTPIEAYEFMSGVVSDEFLIEFEVLNKAMFKEGSARYADPYGAFFDTIRIKELRTNKYSNKELKIIKAFIPDSFDEFKEEELVSYLFR